MSGEGEVEWGGDGLMRGEESSGVIDRETLMGKNVGFVI